MAYSTSTTRYCFYLPWQFPDTPIKPRFAYQSPILAYCETLSAWLPQRPSLFRQIIYVPYWYTRCQENSCIFGLIKKSTKNLSVIARTTKEASLTLFVSSFALCLTANKLAVSCFLPDININNVCLSIHLIF
ncbi:hypothetical protein SAMD00079811_02010 [Scytonema sp. HK-05]|nr:hypothetical protein SAMD00079811_02010 [Scytonema sp. HK-05]